MTTLQVLAPGLLTTVQDLGREGFGPLGVSPSGAADSLSLRLGNRLVGNLEGAAALEMTLLGGTFLFSESAVIALAGSDFGATLDDTPVELYRSVEVRAGKTLRLGPTKSGARCYLCVRGGFDVELFLGSASTHLLCGLGGHEGRALRKGDVLKIWPASGTHQRRRISSQVLARFAPRKILRVTAGPQGGCFAPGAWELLFSSAYRVAEESNRMGIRLQGPAIPTDSAGEMITEGVSLGAIQIPPGGLPIIPFVEQQTTGGYPKIANVISADLPSLGQLRPRDEIRFELVGAEAAHAMLLEQEALLASEEMFVP
jgi:antagonist of KipI